MIREAELKDTYEAVLEAWKLIKAGWDYKNSPEAVYDDIYLRLSELSDKHVYGSELAIMASSILIKENKKQIEVMENEKNR